MTTEATHCVFEFSTGEIFLAFDAELDDAGNAELARTLAAEGRRRVKAGLSDAGTLRARKPEDVVAAFISAPGLGAT